MNWRLVLLSLHSLWERIATWRRIPMLRMFMGCRCAKVHHRVLDWGAAVFCENGANPTVLHGCSFGDEGSR